MLLMAAIGSTAKLFAAKVSVHNRDAPHRHHLQRQVRRSRWPLQGQIVYKELRDATLTCRSVVECRAALTEILRTLAKDIATPGTELNQLVTRQQPR
jgi:hypothetical protein